MPETAFVSVRSNCYRPKCKTEKKPIKRRTPEMMLEVMDERKKKLELCAAHSREFIRG